MCGFSFVSEVLGREIEESFRRRGIRGYSFLKWVLIIQLWVVFESVVLFLPVLIMEISVEADHTTLSDSLLYTGIFPSPGGVSVCFAHGRGGYFLPVYSGSFWKCPFFIF